MSSHPVDIVPRTAAVVLAAGLGTRFGGGKLLADVRGKPMLQHVLDLTAAAELDPVVVVLGNDADEIRRAITWRNETIVRNPHPEDGLAGSVRLGLAAIPGADRAVILLGDQPFLTAEQLAAVLETEGEIVVPRYDGHAGNPVLLGRKVWPLTKELTGDRGMSQLFADYPDKVRYVDLPGTNPDIDTRADLLGIDAAAIVGAGYDALGDRYSQWSAGVADPVRQRMLDDFLHRLPEPRDVLDLGCGPARTWQGRSNDNINLTGVDLSAKQLEIARRNVPTGRFVQADMTTVDFPDRSFDGVVALYSMTHVPRDAQPDLIAKVSSWLRPGGVFLATLSANDSPDWKGEWLGVEMFFSGFPAARNREMVETAQLELLVDEVIEIAEPEGTATFHWLLGRRSVR